MLEYVIRLIIFVPVIGAMAWGSLWLWRKTQMGTGAGWMPGASGRAIEIVEVAGTGAGSKLMLVRFRARELLVAVNRTQTVLLTENPVEADDA
jgi:flagellar protein FliO/FliZ